MIRWLLKFPMWLCNSYHVAKAPAFPSTPLCCLEQAYGASEFLPTLQIFIQGKSTSHALLPNKFNHYNVYNTVHLMFPSKPHVSDCKHQKNIHTTPEHRNGPWKPLSPAHFDTALVIDLHHKEGGNCMVCGTYKFSEIPLILLILYLGLHVAEIHVILTLPPHLGNFPQPLTYVHWFTPIGTMQLACITWDIQLKTIDQMLW